MSEGYFSSYREFTIDGFLFALSYGDGIIVIPAEANFDNPAWVKALRTACEQYPRLISEMWIPLTSAPYPPQGTTVSSHKKKLKPGYVYLLQSPTGAYKIGRTSNPDSRAKTFGIQLPYEVEFICTIQTPDMIQLENELHSLYADKRVNGEWFELSPEDIEYIKGLVS